MKSNKVLGIIFANSHDELIKEMTEMRAMGSIPFGGRYRLIDFTLSNMVNAGITTVGVITKSNYQSLMDHLGSGKSWELARKNGGLYILPPYIHGGGRMYTGHIEALGGIKNFLDISDEEYVVMCDADVVSNFDMKKMINVHIESGADITIGYKHGRLPRGSDMMMFDLDKDGRIKDIMLSPEISGECDFSLDIVVVRRESLMKMVDNALSHSYTSIVRDLYQREVHNLKMYGYEIEGHTAVIDGMQSYFNENMALLNGNIRNTLFTRERMIYTKIRDEMPVKYGLNAEVSGCLIADGCVIEGRVENSILFRGVHVGKGAIVKNCIIMQGSVVGDGAVLEYVCADKNVSIGKGRVLSGTDSYQVHIRKASAV